MKFTEAENNRRQAFVIKLLVKNPSLTNAAIYEKVQEHYGSGMVSARITQFRKLAAKSPTAAFPVQVDKEALRVKHIEKYGTKKVTKSVPDSKIERAAQSTDGALPAEIREALEALKAGVELHYRAGGISVNFSDSEPARVKYDFEPKASIKGEVTL